MTFAWCLTADDAAVTARRAVDASASLAPPIAPKVAATGPRPRSAFGAFAFFGALGFFGAGVGVDATLGVDVAGGVIAVSSSLVVWSSAPASSSSSSPEALSNASSSSSDRASICSSVSSSQGSSDVDASATPVAASGFLKSHATGSSALEPPAPISPSGAVLCGISLSTFQNISVGFLLQAVPRCRPTTAL